MDNEAFFHIVKAPFLKAFVCGMPKDTPVFEKLPVSIEGPTDIPCYLTIINVILQCGSLAPVRLGSLSTLIKICLSLSTSYIDPEAVVGCEDGTARVFDMYSKTCSQIIR